MAPSAEGGELDADMMLGAGKNQGAELEPKGLRVTGFCEQYCRVLSFGNLDHVAV